MIMKDRPSLINDLFYLIRGYNKLVKNTKKDRQIIITESTLADSYTNGAISHLIRIALTSNNGLKLIPGECLIQ